MAVRGDRVASLRVEYRLLDRAVRYALAAAGQATPQRLALATPCAGWDLGALLAHLGDSFDALAEGLAVRSVVPVPGPPGNGGELITGLAGRAGALLCACADVRYGHEPVTVGDRRLTTSVVAITAAIEVAVHGWDISMTCGDHSPVPARLATELLPYAALLVPRRTRPGLFADPVPVPRQACAGDRLVAFLGRQPAGQGGGVGSGVLGGAGGQGVAGGLGGQAGEGVGRGGLRAEVVAGEGTVVIAAAGGEQAESRGQHAEAATGGG
jgi:uncharacterized protein (TIGR03086 family)